MVKLYLYGIKKSEDHCSFVVQKSRLFITKIRDLLNELDFKAQTCDLLDPMGNPDTNYSTTPYSNELYTDKYFYFEDKNYKVDIFFGKERVVFSIFTNKDEQQKITDLMMEFCQIKE